MVPVWKHGADGGDGEDEGGDVANVLLTECSTKVRDRAVRKTPVGMIRINRRVET